MIDLSSGSKTVQITPTITPDSANKNITWTTSNSSVATVSSTGLVTAKGSGKATITVKSSTGCKSAICIITVSNPVQTKNNST